MMLFQEVKNLACCLVSVLRWMTAQGSTQGQNVLQLRIFGFGRFNVLILHLCSISLDRPSRMNYFADSCVRLRIISRVAFATKDMFCEITRYFMLCHKFAEIFYGKESSQKYEARKRKK